MAYKVNDARNRSETYREGGKVEVKKYEEGKKVLSRSEEEQKKRDREYKAMKKRQHERRLKLKKSVVLSKTQKEDLALARKRSGAMAKQAVGKKVEGRFKNYDFGDIDITDITRDVEKTQQMESSMKYQKADKAIKNREPWAMKALKKKEKKKK